MLWTSYQNRLILRAQICLGCYLRVREAKVHVQEKRRVNWQVRAETRLGCYPHSQDGFERHLENPGEKRKVNWQVRAETLLGCYPYSQDRFEHRLENPGEKRIVNWQVRAETQ